MPLQATSRYRTQRPTRIGESIFEKIQTSERVGMDVHDVTEVAASVCASCYATIHDPKELGGHCFRCERSVCTACAALRCGIHRWIFCEAHAARIGERVVCLADPFWRVLVFCLMERPRQVEEQPER